MKKKHIIFTIIIVAFILLMYLIYKGIGLYYYNINSVTTQDYAKVIESLKIEDTIKITNKKLEETSYLTFNNIKIKNDFSEFKKLDKPESTDDNVKYVLYDNDNTTIASFWIGITDTYVNMFKSDLNIFGDNKNIENNMGEFFKEKDITNDIELLKFLVKNKNVKNNIFTSIKDMENNYYIQLLSSIAFPVSDSINLIDGDYTGYIFNLKNNIKEVSILKNNKRYVFTFIKTSYFTDEYIKELLSTIVIE